MSTLFLLREGFGKKMTIENQRQLILYEFRLEKDV